MANYRAVNHETKEEVFYEASVPKLEHLSPPWEVWREEVHASPDVPPPPVLKYGGRRILSKLEFLRMFTQEERLNIRALAKSNSPHAAYVEDYMYLLELAGETNLDDPEIIEGLTMLEQGGVLGQGRTAEILRG